MPEMPIKFSVDRRAEKGLRKLNDIFRGLDESPALLKQFKTKDSALAFLEQATVRIAGRDGYMYVDPWDGSVVISQGYLQEGDLLDLYLDIVHELVHVKQWQEGKNLYDERYEYTDRPTESEAYRVVVAEAKRLGMTPQQILEYLEVPWISKKQLQLLAKELGIQP